MQLSHAFTTLMAFVAIAAAYPTPQLLMRSLARREVLASNLDGYLDTRALGSPDPLTLLSMALNSDSDEPDADSPDKREELGSNSPEERVELDKLGSNSPGMFDALSNRDISHPSSPSSPSSPNSPDSPNSPELPNSPNSPDSPDNSPDNLDLPSKRGELDSNGPSKPSLPDRRAEQGS